MSERMLITKLIRTGDGHAELYGRGHKYVDLRLHDISDLADVGVDYLSLDVGAETPCRFWAHYELSEKLNKVGNPYKDVIMLEQIAAPASSTSTDTSELLLELRAQTVLISRLLETLLHVAALVQSNDVPAADPLPQAPAACPKQEAEEPTPIATYADNTQVAADNRAELQYYAAYITAERRKPANRNALRTWVRDTAKPRTN